MQHHFIQSKSIRDTLILLFLLAVVVFFVAMFATPEQKQGPAFINAQIAGVPVSLEVVDTPTLRHQGLSGRPRLAEGIGMLFVFDTPDTYGFWMKAMRFPIDIVWLDTDKTVVHIVESAAPESFPDVFYPSTPAQYVIELPAGFVRAHMLSRGSSVVFAQQ